MWISRFHSSHEEKGDTFTALLPGKRCSNYSERYILCVFSVLAPSRDELFPYNHVHFLLSLRTCQPAVASVPVFKVLPHGVLISSISIALPGNATRPVTMNRVPGLAIG